MPFPPTVPPPPGMRVPGGLGGPKVVTGGVDKVIFVGSVSVGKAVMRAAADRLTPVILEPGCDRFSPPVRKSTPFLIHCFGLGVFLVCIENFLVTDVIHSFSCSFIFLGPMPVHFVFRLSGNL